MAVRVGDSNIATPSDECNTSIGEGREKASLILLPHSEMLPKL